MNKEDPQRLSPDGRVKPQAIGGRKILILRKVGMTNSLHSYRKIEL
ncbi:hypothetical protein SPJ221_74 [Staphylococcus phage vB_SauH_SPJ2]|nr:hypothetical protein SPJ221_74 [Staphylococcus phage vB_SauH_SPJ2]